MEIKLINLKMRMINFVFSYDIDGNNPSGLSAHSSEAGFFIA